MPHFPHSHRTGCSLQILYFWYIYCNNIKVVLAGKRKGFATNKKAVLDLPALSFRSNENKTTTAVKDKDAAGTCWGQHFCSNPVAQLFPKSPRLNRPCHSVWRHQTLLLSQKHLVCAHGGITSSPQTPVLSYITYLSRGLLLLKELGRVGDRDPHINLSSLRIFIKQLHLFLAKACKKSR